MRAASPLLDPQLASWPTSAGRSARLILVELVVEVFSARIPSSCAALGLSPACLSSTWWMDVHFDFSQRLSLPRAKRGHQSAWLRAPAAVTLAGKVFGKDRFAIGEDDGVLQGVGQLSDVAVPFVGQKHFQQGGRRKNVGRCLGSLQMAGDQCPGQVSECPLCVSRSGDKWISNVLTRKKRSSRKVPSAHPWSANRDWSRRRSER